MGCALDKMCPNCFFAFQLSSPDLYSSITIRKTSEKSKPRSNCSVLLETAKVITIRKV
jgi:hypothetical protein